MAKIVDPDQLSQGVEVVISTAGKTIQLLAAGNLNDDAPGKSSGVTVQAVYSFLKEEWRTDAALNKFKFPMNAIYEAKFELINGWDWADDQTRDLLRDGGFKVIKTTEEWSCIVSLGDFDAPLSDQAYYQQFTGFSGTTSTFDKTGELNENIPIYLSGGYNYQSFLKVFLREAAKTYDQSNLLVDQDLTALTYIVYKIPLANADDIKVTHSDTVVSGTAPYTGMSLDYLVGQRFETYSGTVGYITRDVVIYNSRWWSVIATGTLGNAPATGTGFWEPYDGERQIGTGFYAFNRIVDGNAATIEEIYEWCQWKLRLASNINSNTEGHNFGTVIGKVANTLCHFVGDTLVTEPGVYIDDFDPNDTNDIQFYAITADGGGLDTEYVPVTSEMHTFPFVAAGTIVFSDNLDLDPDGKYWMYFLTNPGGNFDSSGAIIVQDDTDTPITGNITATSIPFTFDYDGNVQGGRTAGTDAAVVIVAMGLEDATWVSAEFTITRATGLTFPVNAPDERNYANP